LSFSAYLAYARPVIVPVVILLIAAFGAAFSPRLPQSLSGITLFGPYLVLLLGVAIAVWFNRGRAFVALTSLFLGYAGHRLAIDLGGGEFAVKAMFTALAVLAPLNILGVLALPERGVNQHHNYRWALVAVAEILLVLWIASAGRSAFSGTAWHAVLDHWLLASPPTPHAGRILIALAMVLAVVRAWRDRSPLDIGLAAALVALLIACEWVESPGVLGAFLAAAGVILLVALLQESHRLAFRDPLTGLPGRRAFEERCSGLGPRHAIAMVDVDHFKKFNDTHGHDVGDDVLKLVAARLSEIGGGGTAYRYGGEEFAVIFPDRGIDDAMPHLESMREAIENYRMAVRGVDRPKDEETGTQLRNRKPADRRLSVTVSMGVAERDETLRTPAQVLRAADKALYRAKHAGRNRVSR
jgi:GGDEF domain-containing protein